MQEGLHTASGKGMVWVGERLIMATALPARWQWAWMLSMRATIFGIIPLAETFQLGEQVEAADIDEVEAVEL
ncbi:MAG: hypothetical protein KA788_02860 [Lacunisphaera sp.]|jgi:hypothetical protein|nr:hypothetical protein [Lacunisphaera sp.]